MVGWLVAVTFYGLGNVACGSRIELSDWIINAAMQPQVNAVSILHCIARVVKSAHVKVLEHHPTASICLCVGLGLGVGLGLIR